MVNKTKEKENTILVVDDEEIIRKFLEDALKYHGYIVLNARNGEEAIEIYEKNMEKIELVILDMIMPGKSGPEVLSELRKINPEVRIIVASGYSEEKFSFEKDWGSHLKFIQKPFDVNALVKKIKEI